MDIILLTILINILEFHLVEADGLSVQSKVSGFVLSEKIRCEYLLIFLLSCQSPRIFPKDNTYI